MLIPEDDLDLNGNEVENNIDINNTWTGQYGCTDYCINLEFRQHGGEGKDYEFDLPETTTIEEEEYDIDIYEVGFTIGALNNESTVTYTHTDETTQTNTIEAQVFTSAESMYETIVYNIRETLDTFIDKFTLTLNDWTLVDDISFKYTTTTTTTTTTTLPPPPVVFEPPPPPEPEKVIVILDNGEEAEYEEYEIEDGTVERDNQRQKNFELYGVELTDEQIERGDLELYDIETTQEEGIFSSDDNLVFDMEDELTEAEIIEYDKQMEIEAKALELESAIENIEFRSQEEAEEYIETVLEVEEFLQDFEEIEITVIEDFELDEIEIIEIVEESKSKEDIEVIEEVIEDEDIVEVLPLEDITEEDTEVFSQEMVNEEIAELEEIVEIPIIEEDVTEEEAEAIIEEYVEELETEEVIEIIEEVNDIGVENLNQVDEEVIEVIAQVVEEVITIAQEEEITDEQAEVIGEVLGFDEETAKEDVEIIAEAVKEDPIVAKAVESFVEKAVENADTSLQPYTLADVVVEVQFEKLQTEGLSAIIDTDLSKIKFDEIGADMTQDQREKAQEVIVPTILVRLASAVILRKTI